MIAHTWRPLEGLESQPCGVDFREIDSLHRQWSSVRAHREESDPDAYRAFLERVGRRWAIETGIIEGIYDIDRGTTETLVEKGLLADLIDRGSTDRDPHEVVRVLKDHQETMEFVTESIRQETPLSGHFTRELHQLLTRNQPTFTAVDQFGRVFEARLDHGGFKTLPNNPTRPDGAIHEYCPPVQVDSEIDRLASLYGGYQGTGAHHGLLVAAWLHHRFAQIHPFQDGNGRVARALLTWHLTREGYPPIVVSRDDRERYIDCLEAADAGDLDPLVKLIVDLERRVILEALGEPGHVAASGMVDEVLGHVVERIGRQNRERLAALRSVNDVARSLQGIGERYLGTRVEQFRLVLDGAGLAAVCAVDQGGPGDDRGHWYRAQVVRTAREAQHWANLNEDRFFLRLSVIPDDGSGIPRLDFVVSLHHVGRQLTGVMAATAFAEARFRERDAEESPGPDFRNCTVAPFTFTARDDAETASERFVDWIEEPLSVALLYWGEFIS